MRYKLKIELIDESTGRVEGAETVLDNLDPVALTHKLGVMKQAIYDKTVLLTANKISEFVID